MFEHILHACSEIGDKVLSIHSRRAATPVLDLLDRFENVRFPILHWFSWSRAELHRAINRDCWFSVGPAMLAGAKGRALAAAMPRDRVLLETDGPFAQLRRAPLQPWDVTLACRSLSGLKSPTLRVGKHMRWAHYRAGATATAGWEDLPSVASKEVMELAALRSPVPVGLQ